MMRVALLALVLVLIAPPATAGRVTISEVLYDAPGPDDGRTFVELFGPPGLSLDGWSLEGVNGRGGGTTHLLDLTSVVIPADGFLVLADADRGGSTRVEDADAVFANLDLQNGPDSVRLLFGLVVVDALGYGSFGAGDAFAGEGRATPGAAPGESVFRLIADVDTDRNDLDFALTGTPTPGSGAVTSVPVAVPEPATFALTGVGLLLLAAAACRYSRKQKTRPSSVTT